VDINGYKIRMQPSPSLHAHINILGADFGSHSDVLVVIDYRGRKAQLIFQELSREWLGLVRPNEGVFAGIYLHCYYFILS